MFKIQFVFFFSLVIMCISLMSVNAAPQSLLRLKGPELPKKAPVPTKGSQPGKLATPSKTAPSGSGGLSAKAVPPAQPALPTKPNPNNACQCYVPAIYSPVCGSDKKVYANKYLLECENTCSKKNLKVVREGKC